MAKPTSEEVMNLESHIQEKSYIWTDGLASYNELIAAKKCDHKIVKDYKAYDKVNHLNNVNSFHERIKNQYNRYKGVSTKYINRYAALFNFQREFADMDDIEYLLIIRARLRKCLIFFYIRQISNEDIFAPNS